MTVQLTDLPSLRVAAVQHVGPYDKISQAFERFGAIAGPAGLFGRRDVSMIAIFHDNPDTTAPDQLRSDAGLVIPDSVPLPSGLVERRIPPGRYAKTEHIGPYEGLPNAWAQLKQWLPANGYAVGTGASFEIYRNTPMDTPKEKLQTEMYLSVK